MKDRPWKLTEMVVRAQCPSITIAGRESTGGGTYRFDVLKPGLAYTLEFVAPSGTAFTRQDRGPNDAMDSDADPRTGRTAPILLSSAQVDITRDAGLVTPASIAGTVFLDADGDGFQSTGEAGAPSWQLYLDLNGNGQVDAGEPMTGVSATGVYSFPGLAPGDFRVRTVPQERWRITSALAAGNVTLLVGQNRTGVDFGVTSDSPASPITPVGGEVHANPTNYDLQNRTSVAIDRNGNYVVVWQSYDASLDYNVYARRFTADGTPTGAPFLVHTVDTRGGQLAPVVASDGDGNFVVCWYNADPYGLTTGLYARRFTAAGQALGTQFRVDSGAATGVANARIDMDDTGRFVIAWEAAGQDGSGLGVYARRYTAFGVPAGAEFLVNANGTSGDQAQPTVDVNAAGDTVIGWIDGGTKFYVQRYSPTGAAVGAPVIANTSGSAGLPVVGIGGDGDLVVGWVGSDSGQLGLQARRFDAAGVPQGLPFAVSTAGPTNPSLLVDDADSFTFVFQAGDENGAGVFVRRYNAAGLPQGSAFRVNTTTQGAQSAPASAGNAAGDAVVSWIGPSIISTDLDVYAQRLAAVPAFASVTGVVWYDVNGDGIRQPNEPTRDDVTVQLFNADGAPAGTTVTAGGGRYRFDSLHPGAAYSVRVTPPTGLVSAPSHRGTDPAADSDIDATASSGIVLAGPAGTLLTVDAGFSLPASVTGVVFDDLNGDGVRQAGEIALPGFVVFLDADGDALPDPGEARSVTAADGSFSLANVSPGDYVLVQVPQDAWTMTTPAARRALTLSTSQHVVGLDLGERTTAAITQGVPIAPSSTIGTPTGAGEVTAVDGQGNYIVVWTGSDPDGSFGIFARRFGPGGTPLAPAFHVNTTIVSDQYAPAVAADAVGDFVILWQWNGYGNGIYGQRYGASGQKVGGEFTVTPYGQWQSEHVAMNKDGSFVVTWSGSAGGPAPQDVFLQRYSATGTPIGGMVTVNTDTDGDQAGPVIGMDAAGNFLVLWNSSFQHVFSTEFGIYGQRFDAGGARVGGQFLLDPDPVGAFYKFAIAPSGDFALVKQPNNSSSVLLERFNAAGVRQGEAITVTNQTNGNVKANVALDAQGNAIVVYGVYRNGWGVYTRRYNTAGVPLGGEERVDPGTYGTSTDYGSVADASVTAGPNGYVVAWAGPTARFYRTATAGDANGDGNVDFNDLVRLAQSFNATGGKTWADGDFNGDGRVDFNDLVLIAQKYNTSTSGAPQPASVSFPEARAAAFATPATKTVDTPSLTPKPAAHPSRPVRKPVRVNTPRSVVRPAPKPAAPPKRPSVAAQASRTSPPDPTGVPTRIDARPPGVFSTRRVSRGSSVEELLE